MKFDRQLRPATETSWLVSYGGITVPRWRMAAILKIDISPYLSEKSSDFHEIVYTAADFELDERHVITNEKVALDRLRVRQNVFLVSICTQLDSCFTFSSTKQTRGNSRKLDKSHISSARDCHCFSKRIIKVWNSLPDCSVVSKTVNTLKYKTNTLHFLDYCCN